MKFLSVCSGIEAASVAFGPLGWKAVAFSEIEPFPSAVLAHHYPDVPNVGDMTAIPERILTGEIEAPDMLCGGTPCFTEGHLVLTDKGYVPIESIKPGDQVMTHLGRMCAVVRVGSKTADVGVLKAVGLLEPITVTGDHPFLAVDWRNQSTKRNGQYARVEHCDEPKWVEAKSMPGRQWCALTTYERADGGTKSAKFSEREAMYVAGMYLGDGHVRRWGGCNKKALVLSLNPSKLIKLEQVIGPSAFTVTQERTSVRATINDTDLCEWLEEQFGCLAHLKRIPAWVLGHEHRAILLQGYLDTDGHQTKNGVGISTTSRALAYGAADLLNAEGMTASVALIETPDTCIIEGRTVNQRNWYQVRGFNLGASRKSRVRHGYLLRSVQSFTEAGTDTVFNIEVEGDNSYVVNGVVVHNCQAFSVAGLRKSLDDARGNLSLTFCEIANAIDTIRVGGGKQPCIVFWENVPGVLSTKDNAFGCFLAGLAGEDDPLVAPGGKWTNAGAVFGPKRAVAWRVLDAQYFGVAQRRRRVFVVASAREGFDPAAVLFEFDGVRRDSAPSRETGQGTAAGTGAGTGASTAERSHWDGDFPHPTLNQSAKGSGGVGSSNQELFSQRGAYLASQPVFTMAHGQGGAEIGFGRGPTLTCNHEAPIAAYAVRTANTSANGHDAGAIGMAHWENPNWRCRDCGETWFDRFATTPESADSLCSPECPHCGNEDGNVWVDEQPKPGLPQGQAVAVHQSGMQPCGFCGHPFDNDNLGRYGCPNCEGEGLEVTHTLRGEGFDASEDGTGRGTPLVPVSFAIQAGALRTNPNSGPDGVGVQADHAYTLEARAEVQAVAFVQNSRDEVRLMGGDGSLIGALAAETGAKQQCYIAFNQTPAMGCGSSGGTATVAVAFTDMRGDDRGPGIKVTGDIANTMHCAKGPSEQQAVATATQVRRLTPVECERLQGFPDNYSQIPWRKKPASECPDGPRYKALGNSWAVPCVAWIGRRIDAAIRATEVQS